jgi:hypothetical protein
MRLGAAVILVVLAIAAFLRLFEPRTGMLLSAMRQLGPISGWRCVESPTYVYDPSQERPDAALLGAPPEGVILDQVPGVAVDSVEVDLRGGEAVVSAHVVGPESNDERLVYVLTPGRQHAVTVDVGTASSTICNSQLSEWKIVGEHHLG